MDESLGKSYKLCSKKIIDSIFESGKRIHSFPFMLSYQQCELPINKVPFQLVIAVPKKLYKRAYQRNRIKRLMKECVRKNKHILEDFLRQESNKNKQFALFLVYRHHEELTYVQLYQKTIKLIEKLISTIESNEQ